MKISEQWLREWADPDVDTEGLAEQLTMAGLEVDAVEPCAPPLDGVVVGHVLEKRPHPDADRLSLCLVDIGEKDSIHIVCGAANVQVGGAYPVATIGTELPGGLKIERSKIRGAESFGMLCSAVELGIAEQADGLLELDSSAEPGVDIVDALALDDMIIDLDLTPNRADCFSIIGTARDVAAFNGISFDEPRVAAIAATLSDKPDIRLAAGPACPAFAGRIIRGLDTEAVTPLWMVERLRRSGVRALHPVVDVTNYVMLELGQPMHAYDLTKLTGAVCARMASKGEQLTLLDGQTIELAEDVLVIADEKAPVGLAGIMGGDATAVSAATRDILLESAFFSPAVIAGRARRYGMHTDASVRFERGVDFAGQVRAIERATELLLDIAGGQAGPVVDQRDAAALPKRSPVSLRRDRLERLLGMSLPDERVADLLKSLGFRVEAVADGWQVQPTSARFDIAIEEDLIEEVARLHGYDNLPETPQAAATRLTGRSETRLSPARLAAALADRGYQENITYSFVDPELQQALLGDAEELTLLNPLAARQSVMRRSLWPGLLASVMANRNRQKDRVRIFEQGVTFGIQANEIKEQYSVGGVAWGPLHREHWDDPARPADIFDIKSDLAAVFGLTGAGDSFELVAAEHPALRPGRTASIRRDGAAVGWLGELHPKLAKKWNFGRAPILFELAGDSLLDAAMPAYRPISRFPSVRRDLAVVVDENLPAGALLSEVRQAAGSVLQDVRVFDVYCGNGIEKGLKSVALGLILQETSRTLTESEIEGVSKTVVERLSDKFNATIRE